MTREEVIKVVRKERRFQEKVVPQELEANNKVVDYVKYMRNYLNPLLKTGLTKAQRLESIRKITALGFAAMEKFGAPDRQGNY